METARSAIVVRTRGSVLVVQLASLKTRAATLREWSRLREAHSDLLAGCCRFESCRARQQFILENKVLRASVISRFRMPFSSSPRFVAISKAEEKPHRSGARGGLARLPELVAAGVAVPGGHVFRDDAPAKVNFAAVVFFGRAGEPVDDPHGLRAALRTWRVGFGHRGLSGLESTASSSNLSISAFMAQASTDLSGGLSRAIPRGQYEVAHTGAYREGVGRVA